MKRKFLATILGCLWACSGDPGGSGPKDSRVAFIDITVPTSNLDIGDSTQVNAIGYDTMGNPVSGLTTTWTSSNSAVLTVTSTGKVRAISTGGAFVRATIEQTKDSIFLAVLAPLDSIVIAPAADTVIVRQQLQLFASPFDTSGTQVQRDLTWSSSDSARATVVGGVVTGVGPGPVTITAEYKGTVAAVSLHILPAVSVVLIDRSDTLMTLGELQQFGLVLKDSLGNTLTGRPVTWNGTSGITVTATGLVNAVQGGVGFLTAASEGARDSTTLLLFMDSRLGSVTTANAHSCGLSTMGTVYCWGDNAVGQLGGGPGQTEFLVGPVPLALDTQFAVVSSKGSHSCGLDAAGAAFCWGLNDSGELGFPTGLGPAPVGTALTFDSITAGLEFTCALDAGAAVCWGDNIFGQLGQGTRDQIAHPNPQPVPGSLSFTQLSAGHYHVCGLVNGAAYCWGLNSNGQLGTGTTDTIQNAIPQAVTGGLSFSTISAGGVRTCALTSAGEAYCWGENQPTPTLMNQAEPFVYVSVGNSHACAIGVSGQAYCWGRNQEFELGDGTNINPTGIVSVAGGLSFSRIAAGDWHTCGITTSGLTYCWGMNDLHRLGDGTGIWRSTPTQIVAQP